MLKCLWKRSLTTNSFSAVSRNCKSKHLTNTHSQKLNQERKQPHHSLLFSNMQTLSTRGCSSRTGAGPTLPQMAGRLLRGATRATQALTTGPKSSSRVQSHQSPPLLSSLMCYFSTSVAGGRREQLLWQHFHRSGNSGTQRRLGSERPELSVQKQLLQHPEREADLVLQSTSAEQRSLGRHHHFIAPAAPFCL